MKAFKDYPELTSSLALDLIDAIKDMDFGDGEASASFGASEQSCSAYVDFCVYDEEIEEIGSGKIRFSDHPDRYGSDVTVFINDAVVAIKDDDGEYVETRISEESYNALLAEAMDFFLNATKA